MMTKNKEQDLLNTLALRGSKLSKQEKLLPTIVVSVVLVTIVIFLGPIISSIKNTGEKLNQNRKLFTDLERQKNILVAWESGEASEKLSKQFLYAEEYLPSVKPSLKTLINLSALARMEKVQFSGLKLKIGVVKNPETDEKTKNKNGKKNTNAIEKLQNFDISFSVSGDRENLLKFISKMKEISPLMKINEISTSIKQGNETGGAQSMGAQLDVTVYYQDLADTIKITDTDSLDPLTDEELALLDKIEGYIFTDTTFSQNTSEDNTSGVVIGVTNPFETVAQ
jgi:hypothetical protein